MWWQWVKCLLSDFGVKRDVLDKLVLETASGPLSSVTTFDVMLTSCSVTFGGRGRLILSFYVHCFCFVNNSVDRIMHCITVSLSVPRFRTTDQGQFVMSLAGPAALLQGPAIHKTLAKKQVSWQNILDAMLSVYSFRNLPNWPIQIFIIFFQSFPTKVRMKATVYI